jgi:hypothetical protein
MKKEKIQKLEFYEISQNNSGGSFVTDGKLCHRLFIEAFNVEEADIIAENLGCYYNGVDEGYDCPCCGDRWYPGSAIDIKNLSKIKGGYPIDKFLSETIKSDDPVKDLMNDYPDSEWIKKPEISKKYGSDFIAGAIKIKSVEEYAQILANLYGYTYPDVRIFYHNGEIKEIYSDRVEKPK